MSIAGQGGGSSNKRPTTAYGFFVKMCYEEHKKKYPSEHVQVTEISKKCSDKWKTMTDSEKRRFFELAQKDVERYQAELQMYGTNKRKKQKKDPNAPKRPLSAFFFFSQVKRPDIQAGHSDWRVGQVAQELGRRWKDMTQEEKQAYEEMATNDRERYENEMKEFKAGRPVASAIARQQAELAKQQAQQAAAMQQRMAAMGMVAQGSAGYTAGMAAVAAATQNMAGVSGGNAASGVSGSQVGGVTMMLNQPVGVTAAQQAAQLAAVTGASLPQHTTTVGQQLMAATVASTAAAAANQQQIVGLTQGQQTQLLQQAQLAAAATMNPAVPGSAAAAAAAALQQQAQAAAALKRAQAQSYSSASDATTSSSGILPNYVQTGGSPMTMSVTNGQIQSGGMGNPPTPTTSSIPGLSSMNAETAPGIPPCSIVNAPIVGGSLACNSEGHPVTISLSGGAPMGAAGRNTSVYVSSVGEPKVEAGVRAD